MASGKKKRNKLSKRSMLERDTYERLLFEPDIFGIARLKHNPAPDDTNVIHPESLYFKRLERELKQQAGAIAQQAKANRPGLPLPEIGQEEPWGDTLNRAIEDLQAKAHTHETERKAMSDETNDAPDGVEHLNFVGLEAVTQPPTGKLHYAYQRGSEEYTLDLTGMPFETTPGYGTKLGALISSDGRSVQITQESYGADNTVDQQGEPNETDEAWAARKGVIGDDEATEDDKVFRFPAVGLTYADTGTVTAWNDPQPTTMRMLTWMPNPDLLDDGEWLDADGIAWTKRNGPAPLADEQEPPRPFIARSTGTSVQAASTPFDPQVRMQAFLHFPNETEYQKFRQYVASDGMRVAYDRAMKGTPSSATNPDDAIIHGGDVDETGDTE
jgi:hypothetical protein